MDEIGVVSLHPGDASEMANGEPKKRLDEVYESTQCVLHCAPAVGHLAAAHQALPYPLHRGNVHHR
jgi:hypothetical protein